MSVLGMGDEFIRQVLNPSRLAALRRLGLLDSPTEAAFDRLSDLAGRILKTPIALVTLVDDTRQFFKSCRGLPEPWATWRESPLSHSFCQHVLASTEPLVIEDARSHPVFGSNLATRDWAVIAYLGVPLVLSDSLVLGSFCVIDTKPRQWTTDDVEALNVLARAAVTEIELRSEMKRSEEANRQLAGANADLRMFTYSVGHDLRSHLQRLRCFTELLIEENVTAPAECIHYMHSIRRSQEKLTALFDGLLNLARASTLELKTTLVDFTALAHDLVAELAPATSERQVEIVIQPGMKAHADPALARLLLQTLLGNAFKFTSRRKEARIEFSASEHKGTTQFAVQDNGAGFPSDRAEHLFQPFHRLHSAEEFPGTGLGLQGARRIVERHGGAIQAEGELGAGARFTFTLERPPAISARAAAVRDAIGSEPPAPVLGPPRSSVGDHPPEGGCRGTFP